MGGDPEEGEETDPRATCGSCRMSGLEWSLGTTGKEEFASHAMALQIGAGPLWANVFDLLFTASSWSPMVICRFFVQSSFLTVKMGCWQKQGGG